jgi:hypothetical protein
MNKLLELLRLALKGLFRRPAARKEFFAFGLSHGVPESMISEYYSHCKRVSWLDLHGKPIQWKAILPRLAKISPNNQNQGGSK